MKPNKIRILSTDFKIKWMDKEQEEIHDEFGHMSSSTQTISISSCLSPTKTADTFLHELFHAIFYMASLDDIIKNVENEKEREELVCSQLGSILQTVIMQNPGVIEWYLELLRKPSEPTMEEILYP